MLLADSHCHLDAGEFDATLDYLRAARARYAALAEGRDE